MLCLNVGRSDAMSWRPQQYQQVSCLPAGWREVIQSACSHETHRQAMIYIEQRSGHSNTFLEVHTLIQLLPKVSCR